MGNNLLSQRGRDWAEFSAQVADHIENYANVQYGDAGSDAASKYTAEYCLSQISKYILRHGKDVREGQSRLDILKIAHYAQFALFAYDREAAQKPKKDTGESEAVRK